MQKSVTTLFEKAAEMIADGTTHSLHPQLAAAKGKKSLPLAREALERAATELRGYHTNFKISQSEALTLIAYGTIEAKPYQRP